MGHRANFAVVQDGRPKLYYSRWAALTLPHSLFYGPEFALRYIDGLETTDALLDEVWCEGAAVLDRDTRQMLLFVHDVRFHSGFRRFFLPLLRHNWPGWEVRWADQGIVDVALHLGIDPVEVRDERMEICHWGKAELGDDSEYVSSLITLGCQGSAFDYSFFDSLTGVLAWGPDLIDMLPGRALATLGKEEMEDIESGAFLEPARKEMWVWWSNAEDDRRVGRIANLWPGWTVRRHNQGLPKHIELSGRDAARFDIDEAEGIRRIVEFLSEYHSFDPQEAFRSIVGGGNEADVQAGRGFFSVDRPESHAEMKEEILRRAIAAFRAGAGGEQSAPP